VTETEQKNQVESLYSAAVKELYGLAFYTVLDIKAAEALTAGAFSDTFRILSDKADLEAFRIKAASCLYRSMKRTSKNPGYASGDSPAHQRRENQLDLPGEKRNRTVVFLSKLSLCERFLLLLFCSDRFSSVQISQILCLPRFLVQKKLRGILQKAAFPGPSGPSFPI
jgi:hypothetical protein